MSLGRPQDALTALLEDIETDGSSDTTDQRKPRAGCSRQRDRLEAARNEVASLQRQIELLHENHELVESLDRLMDRSSADVHQWKFRAIRERSRTLGAKQRNALLRRRLGANAKLLEQVIDLIRKQTARAGSFDRRFVRLHGSDGSALAFSNLRARLDARSSQLDAVIRPCDSAISAIDSVTDVAPTPWSFSSSDQGINVVMSESFAVPFPSALVCDIGSRVALLYGLEVLADNQVDQIARSSQSHRRQLSDQVSGGCESDRRMIFRRIEDTRGTFLLWEGSSYWQIDGSQLKYEARDSGWALISPQSGDVSFIRYGGSLQILATSEARLKANSVLVTGIVRAIQSHLRSRIGQMENELMDSHSLRQRANQIG